MKIYVGCSLTHASDEFKKDVADFKDTLRNDYEVLDFVGLVSGTAKDVYEWDTQCVRTCDLFIADVSYPAIGLGYELGIAHEMDKPILAIAKKGSSVSRIVLGMHNNQYSFHWYDDYKDVMKLVKEKILMIQHE